MSVDVVRFDFVSQLLSSLQDSDKMVQENLVMDINQPVVMHRPAHDRPFTEVLDGKACRDACWNAIKQHKARGGLRSLFVVPICCWGNATHTDQCGQFKLEPWARCNSEFWKVLGCVNTLKLAKAEKKKLKEGKSCRACHRQLEVMFYHLKESLHRLRNVTLPLGPF